MPRYDDTEWAKGDPPLVRELLALRGPGVWGTGDNPCGEIPQLEAIGRLFVRRRDTRSQRSILRALFARVLKHPDLSDTDRRATALEYGLTEDTQYKRSSERRALAAKEYYRELESYRRTSERGLIRLLAVVIEKVASAAQKPSFEQEDIVRRDRLFSMLSDAAQSSRKLALVGPSGMGKSVFAASFVREVTALSEDYLYFDTTPEGFSFSLAKQLRKWGVDISSTDDSTRRMRLYEMLASDDSPQYIVLDDVSETGVISQVVPDDPVGRVIVTTNDSAILPDDFTIIQVGQMEQDEGIALTRLLIPDIGELNSQRLVTALQGHPIAISQACGLNLGKPNVLDDFMEELQSDPKRALSAGEVRKKNLVHIHRRLLAEIDQEAPDAKFVLEAVVFLHAENIPFEVVVHYFAQQSRGGSRVALSRELAEHALDYLIQKNLVDVAETYFSPLTISIHGLVQSLLQDLMRARLEEACPPLRLLVLKALDNLARRAWRVDVKEDFAMYEEVALVLQTHYERLQDLHFDSKIDRRCSGSPWGALSTFYMERAEPDWRLAELERLGFESSSIDELHLNDPEFMDDLIDHLTIEGIDEGMRARFRGERGRYAVGLSEEFSVTSGMKLDEHPTYFEYNGNDGYKEVF